MQSVRAIVLAAGLSSRYGANKVLALWQGRPMIRSVVDALTDLPTLVVTGRDPELVSQAVAPSPTVFNDRFAEGMGTSLALGVRNLPDCDGILVALADMPDLSREVVRALVRAFSESAPDAIVAPVYAQEPDRLGHPVIFSSTYRVQLEGLTGDEGARGILRRNPDAIVRVPVPGMLIDIDAPG